MTVVVSSRFLIHAYDDALPIILRPIDFLIAGPLTGIAQLGIYADPDHLPPKGNESRCLLVCKIAGCGRLVSCNLSSQHNDDMTPSSKLYLLTSSWWRGDNDSVWWLWWRDKYSGGSNEVTKVSDYPVTKLKTEAIFEET